MSEQRRFPFSLDEIRGKWQQLSRAKKISAVVLITAIIITLIFSGQALLRPRMSPLFTGLEPADAGRITAKLKELGVPYELTQEGKTILVQDDKVYDLRIQLASDGTLLGSSAGFELFDQTKLGSTDFERRLNYQRALQEELRRTIVQLEEVEQARVHLTLPEPSVFIAETTPASASIVLKLNPFSRLEPKQIQGIIHLVAGSVENLSPENITIVDTYGNLLSDLYPLDESSQIAEATLKQLEVKRTFERELEQRVQRLLDRVFGPGQAIAMLTAELDFNSRESTVITYAEGGVPRSHTITRETWIGGEENIPNMGEAGTDSNIPGYVLPEETEGGFYERTDEITNYEINETNETEIFAPGRLLRLHTAVVVNTKNGKISPFQVEQIRNTVAAAVGYQEERGDSIDVQGMNFDTTQMDQIQKVLDEAEQQEQLQQYIRYGILGLVGLLSLIFLVRFLAKRRERAVDLQEGMVPVLPDSAEDALLPESETPIEESSLNQQVRQLAERDPETAAFLIRTWLSEE